jgi:alkanesulfonate monooxygenase SsuD/methylene tetrahydromethanopterin reductase-like flavin-dependent oxidoreductase (luciferase family)
MKFALFYQAQLPKPLDSDEWNPGDEAKLFQDTLTQAEFADKLGFDYIFVAEHHFTSEYNHMTASDVMLGAIAARTRQIRVGSSIVQMMPANNHPVKVAENAATIDLISNGRYEFGVGTGGPTEQDAFWPDLTAIAKAGKVYDVLWEALGETLKMMTMNPYPGCSLEYLNLPLGNVVPKPMQKPHPPLWLAVTSERSLKLAAERGMGALCLAQGGPEVVRQRVELYWKTIETGLKPVGAINPVVATFANTMVAATDERAREHERGGAAFSNYAIRRAHDLTHATTNIHREFAMGGVAFENKNTVDTPEYKEHTERLAKQGSLDASADAPGSIIGSPETARKRFMDYEATGVDVIGLAQQVGLRRHEDIMESLEQIGKLLPEFKERHERASAARAAKMESFGFPVSASI